MKNKNPKEILAKARAVHFAMHHGVISYEKAHELTDPLLREINDYIVKTAKKFDQRPKKLVFQDLGRTL